MEVSSPDAAVGPVRHISQSMANMGLASVAGEWPPGEVDTRLPSALVIYSFCSIWSWDRSSLVRGSFSNLGVGFVCAAIGKICCVNHIRLSVTTTPGENKVVSTSSQIMSRENNQTLIAPWSRLWLIRHFIPAWSILKPADSSVDVVRIRLIEADVHWVFRTTKKKREKGIQVREISWRMLTPMQKRRI